MTKAFQYIFLGILFSLGSPVLARDYMLELIVFERTNVSSDVEERWVPGSNQGLVHQETFRDLATRTEEFPTQTGVNRLNRIETELLNSGYRVIQSLNWTQPAEVFHRAPVIAVGAHERLQGFIKVYKTSLIFIDLNLVLNDPAVENTAVLEPESVYGNESVLLNEKLSYFINEKRRVKFKEVHYFDHPKFGAIVTVWPES